MAVFLVWPVGVQKGQGMCGGELAMALAGSERRWGPGAGSTCASREARPPRRDRGSASRAVSPARAGALILEPPAAPAGSRALVLLDHPQNVL